MKALYVTGSTPISDIRPAERLTQLAPDLTMTYVITVADALVEVRKNNNYQVLFTDPSLPQNETLALITSLRRDRAPLALVPVVAEEHRDFLASAVAAGADDVLLLQGETVLHAAGTLLRIRHSPHLLPAENRPRLRLLYAGRDQLVWTLLEQIPFIKAEKAMLGADGSCVVRIPGADTGRLRCDVVLIDEQPGDAHPLQVVKSIKSQASDLPVVVLTAANDLHTATAALDLGADEAVSKAGIYRRRLIATLRRLHQRVEMDALHSNVAARETRLRNIVERLPAAVAVISDDGRVLAVNNTALALLGAQQPSDLVGRQFNTVVVESDKSRVDQTFESIRRGQSGGIRTAVVATDGSARDVELRGVLLERDARGGRGVVAVMLPVEQVALPAEAPAVDPAAVEELHAAAGQAADRLEALDAAHQAAIAEHETALLEFARERIAWESDRKRFEARLHEVEAHRGAVHQEVEAERARFEQAQLMVSAAGEARISWDQERVELHARLATLDEAQRELAHLQAAHEAGAERERRLLDELNASRATAESAGHDRADRDRERAELAEVRAELDREREARANDRAEWDRTRVEWDRAREDGEREERDREREARDREREDWNRERTDVRAHIVDLEREIGELSASRGMLDAARQREQQLTDELASAQSAAARERDAAYQARAAAQEEQSKTAAVEQAVQHLRSEFAQQSAAIELAHARAREQWDAERMRLASELDAATRSFQALQAEREQQAHTSQSELVAGGRFGAVVATRGGVVVRANEPFAQLLGYPGVHEFVSVAAASPVPGLVLRGFDEMRDATGAPVRASFSLDHRDGRTIHGVGAVRRLDEWRDGEPLFEHMVLSVSRELDLEDRLRKARRLEAIGSLAAAMVPELESLVSHWMQGGAEAHDAQQAAEVIGQLSAFSRHQTGTAGTIDLADVVRRLQSLLEQLAGPQHQVRVDLRPAPASDVSETELAQLVTALVVFGRDLLPAGGSLALATDLDDEIGTYVASETTVRRPRHARLRVTLRGYGLRPYMASEALDALVARCAGTIAAESTGPRSVVVMVTLPGARSS